jgi:hypothetical protein
MNCEDVKKYISLFDEMDDAELKDHILEHINTCDSCKSTYKNINLYKEAIKSASEVDPPKGFEKRVIEKLSTGGVMKSNSRRVYQYGYGIIAAALVIIMFFLYLPKEITEANYYDINFALKLEKSGKGPADMINFETIDAKLNILLNEANAAIESKEANKATGYYDYIMISVPANSASSFINGIKNISALELNLPDQLPEADLYRFKIHFDMINFTSANITGDTKDEIVVQFISGANRGKWIVYERTDSTFDKWSELKILQNDSSLVANYTMESGDFNGDGYDDILLYEYSNFTGLTIRVLINNRNMGLVESNNYSDKLSIPTTLKFVSIKPYDADHNGTDDLLWLSIDDSSYVHFNGMNIKTSYKPIKVNPVEGRLPFIFPADFTSDKNMDVVLKQTWGGESTIFVGRTDGGYEDEWHFYRSFSGDYHIWSGNYNGDGLTDLFVKNGGPFIPGTFYLIVNTDNGTFEGAPRFKLSYPY